MESDHIMSLGTNIVSPDTVCEGCLSVDRKLTLLVEEDSKWLLSQILHPVGPINCAPMLCWECAAVLHKFTKFKKQVKTAHENLVRYLLRETVHLTSLSNLKYNYENGLKYEITLLDNKDIRDKPEQPKEVIGDNSIKSNSQYIYNEDIENENVTHYDIETKNGVNRVNKTRNRPSTIEPLAFVKIEEDESDDGVVGDIDGYIGDEKVDIDGVINQVAYHSSLKTELKPETFAKSVKLKTKLSKKSKFDDFNDSDDEPLNAKKCDVTDIENKPKGKRKKKNKDEVKVDRRKHPRPKREKPAGVVTNARVTRKLQQLNVASGQLEMVVLSWEEVELERERALQSVSFTRHEYRCTGCVVGFNHRLKLDNHMKKHDPCAGGAACSVCLVVCRDAHALAAHRRRHRVRWRCCLCGALFSRAAVAADHYARAHRAPPPTHTCAVCGHTETTLGKLRNHLKNHAERQKCELCGKTFRDRTSLRTHLFIHRGEKEYSCPRCEKRFLFKKAMEVHLVTHEAPAQLYCHQCDVNFKNRMSYYQHMKYNLKHIDPAKLKYACHLCDKKFVKAVRLEEHNIAVHLKVTPIKCTVPGCHFACSSRPVLRTHVRMIHRGGRARRDHVCDTCGKAYTTKKTLEGHIRSHTGERPFRCSLCPSTFGYEAALYNHNKLVHLKAKVGRSRRAAVPPPPADWPPPADIQTTAGNIS